MYSHEQLIILDADGTTIDAFSAIGKTFAHHGMDIGDLARFQKRHRLFKYLGGLKEFPVNLQKQLGKQKRSQLIATLTEVYREEAQLYPGIAELIQTLLATPDLRIGLITRNITIEPEETLGCLFLRHGVDTRDLDFLLHVPLAQDKGTHFRVARERFAINPARAYACGDEHKDFLAAISAGMHPFMVSYGFENHMRLTQKFGVPEEVISPTPAALCERIYNALNLV
ncbi:MAG: HAD family hydrolase [Gammaproteobacteria bacterium]|nr:HAD family hydrolase [Gammaproteobacteria bacterium]MCP5195394.1 HAD family hydrolase [Gammaproteobacteria bacterium]